MEFEKMMGVFACFSSKRKPIFMKITEMVGHASRNILAVGRGPGLRQFGLFENFSWLIDALLVEELLLRGKRDNMIIMAFQCDGRLFLTQHTNYQTRALVTVGGYLTYISLWLTHDIFAEEKE